MKQDVLNQLLVDDFADHSLGRDAVLFFCNLIFITMMNIVTNQIFFSRKLRPHVLKHLDFSNPLLLDLLPVIALSLQTGRYLRCMRLNF